jgi:CheY-like chemotaxis protein
MTPRILIVDDNRADIDLILLAFEEAGLNAFIVTAQDGLEALGKMEPFQPQVVLLDINMPRANGFELLESMRANAQLAGTPVIMMSSSDSAFEQARARQLGVMRFWVKPTRFSDWVALVGTLPSLIMVSSATDADPRNDAAAPAASIRPPR